MPHSYFAVPSGQSLRGALPRGLVARLQASRATPRSAEEAAARHRAFLEERARRAAGAYSAAKSLALSRRLFDFHDRQLAGHRQERQQQGAGERRAGLLGQRAGAIAEAYGRWYDERARRAEAGQLARTQRDRYGLGRPPAAPDERVILGDVPIRVAGPGPGCPCARPGSGTGR